MKSVLLYLALMIPVFAAAQRHAPAYRDTSLPVESRITDLMKRMTLAEKVAQMQDISDNPLHSGMALRNLFTSSTVYNASTFNKARADSVFRGLSYGTVAASRIPAARIPAAIAVLQDYLRKNTRLGIPIMLTSEGLHGVLQPGSTIFPQAIALGATFNPGLVRRMAGMIAAEARAEGINQLLAPDLDLARELRWGRVEESYGEDPYLVGRMGVAYVQGCNPHRIICTPKHFITYGSPRGGLNLSPVAGGEHALYSIYLKPFEAVIREGRPLSIMNSYNAYDQVPIASSHEILTDILKQQCGFRGYVYSDWGSVGMLCDFHRTAKGPADAALQAVKAGVDLEVWSSCFEKLDSLVRSGGLPVSLIDSAVRRILRAKFAAGLFDGPDALAASPGSVHSDSALSLALELARQSIVLLKNDGHLLPFGRDIRSIAVVGPNAGHTRFGDYTWTNGDSTGITPLQGMQAIARQRHIRLAYAPGCDSWSRDKTGFAAAVRAASACDAVVVFAGSTSGSPGYPRYGATSGESYDLASLHLPGVQEALIRALKKTGKPVVLVLVAGKPFALHWEKAHIPAILVQWYGGEQGGRAIAEVLFGKVNPSGKLNVSFPQSVGHLPVFYNYYPDDKGYYHNPGSPEKPGRDYVFSSPDALWSFGHGLSYTTFAYQAMRLSKDVFTPADTCRITVTVRNTGDRDGAEVVQLYVRDKVSSVVTPVRSLKRFRKVFIPRGQTVTVSFALPVSALALYNKQMEQVVEPGDFELEVGAASDDIRLQKQIRVQAK